MSRSRRGRDGYSWRTDLRCVAHFRILDGIRHLDQLNSFRPLRIPAIHRTWNGEIFSYIEDWECLGARLGISCDITPCHPGHAKHCEILQALMTKVMAGFAPNVRPDNYFIESTPTPTHVLIPTPSPTPSNASQSGGAMEPPATHEPW